MTKSTHQRTIVGVMGSGAPENEYAFAEDVGRLIAECGFHLLTGGGFGVMTAASRGFASVANRQGQVLAISPVQKVMTNERFDEYPNPFVEINIQTHLVRDGGPDDPFTRNHINILTAHALVFCPGSVGTHCELDLAKKYGTPSILLLPDGKTIDGLSRKQLDSYGFPIVETVAEVQTFLAQHFSN